VLPAWVEVVVVVVVMVVMVVVEFVRNNYCSDAVVYE